MMKVIILLGIVALLAGCNSIQKDEFVITGTISSYPKEILICAYQKDGNFVFRKQSLEHIMEIVERWYDLKVTFEDEWCKQVSFSGNVERYDDFSKLAEMLEATGSVKFRIKNNEIYVTKR